MHERLEKLLLSLCIDAWPGILHHQSYIFIIQIEFNEDSPALWRVFDGVTDEVIEEPVKEKLQEDVSDLEQTESLDEILAVEGISLEGGSTEENVMGMYHAGFSILEISKLLDLGVGEVKYVIDKHQGE